MAENDVRFSRIPADAAERWRVVDDVCCGDQRMRNETYLPTLNAADGSEDNKARNRAYRQRAVLFSATSFTRDGLIGLAFHKPPTVNLPEKLKYLEKDADGAGVNLDQQAKSVLGEVLECGRHGMYVDFSAELKRPIVKVYEAEDIINWRNTMRGGKTVLSMVVLREDAEQDDGYAIECIDQWRELRLNAQGLCSCRVWQLDEKGDPVVVQVEDANGVMVDEVVLRSVGAPLDFIPFTFIGSQNNDSSIDDSPLYPLAKVNVAHFCNSADYEDSVFYSGQAQPWMSGLDVAWRTWMESSNTYVGGRNPILLPAGGAFGFAQPLPNTLVKEAMDQKEDQMRALGARLIDHSQQVAKTATQSGHEYEASTSVLATCIGNLNDAYEQALDWCARYLDLNLDMAGAYLINVDFEAGMVDPQMVTSLVAAWQSGLIAKGDVRHVLRRHGTLPTNRTDALINADIGAEPPPIASAVPAVANGTPPTPENV